jgi:hypothetical protein
MAMIARKPTPTEGHESEEHRETGDEHPELLGALAGRHEGVGTAPQAVDEGPDLDTEGHRGQAQHDVALEGRERVHGLKRRRRQPIRRPGGW